MPETFTDDERVVILEHYFWIKEGGAPDYNDLSKRVRSIRGISEPHDPERHRTPASMRNAVGRFAAVDPDRPEQLEAQARHRNARLSAYRRMWEAYRRDAAAVRERVDRLLPRTGASEFVRDVPIEDGVAEGYDIAPQGRTQAIREEARLQSDFVSFLRARGDDVTRKKIHPRGAAHPLYNDLFNRTRNQLVEVKANGTRDSVRMAIGQLADYARFVPRADRAVLLNAKPDDDLLDLLVSQGVSGIWRTRGGFADNAGGRFA